MMTTNKNFQFPCLAGRRAIFNFQFEYFIYLILLSLPLYLVKLNIFGIPATILEIEIYVGTIWFLFFSLRQKKLKKYLVDFFRNPFFIPWLIFFIAGIISVFVSPDKRTALGIFKAYFFDAEIFFFIFVSVVKTKEELKKCFLALTLSALILSGIGLAQYLFFPQFLQEGRIKSIFSSPNYLSLYLTPISFLCFIFLEHFKKINLFKSKLLYCYIVISLVIILTLSRGAWLGSLLGLVFFFGMLALQKTKAKKLKIFFALLFLIGVLASFFFVVKGSYGLGLVSQNRVYSSDNIRKEIWATSFDIGRGNKWLGVGLGNFQNYFNEYTKNRINYSEYIAPHAITPHNIFLNIWLQTGLMGLIGLIGLIGVFFKECFIGLKKSFLINLVLMSAIIAILGQGLVDSSIWKNDLMIVFWFLIGSSYIINRKDNRQ